MKKVKSFCRVLPFSMIILDRDGGSGGEGERVARHELMHDRHTVSLLTDHLVFSPKYRGKILLGEVAEAAEEIIRENCKELDIEVMDKPFFRKESFTKETIISVKRF